MPAGEAIKLRRFSQLHPPGLEFAANRAFERGACTCVARSWQSLPPEKEQLLNKRKNLAMRKHRLTAQKKKARQKGIDPSANALWNVGPWEERRSRGWRNQRSGAESTDTGST